MHTDKKIQSVTVQVVAHSLNAMRPHCLEPSMLRYTDTVGVYVSAIRLVMPISKAQLNESDSADDPSCNIPHSRSSPLYSIFHFPCRAWQVHSYSKQVNGPIEERFSCNGKNECFADVDTRLENGYVSCLHALSSCGLGHRVEFRFKSLCQRAIYCIWHGFSELRNDSPIWRAPNRLWYPSKFRTFRET